MFILDANTRIVSYTLLDDTSTIRLTGKVMDFLQMGWQPLGGVAAAGVSSGAYASVHYTQAMVKIEKTE